MTSTATTARLLNLTPVTIYFPTVGSPRVAHRSGGADGNSAEGLVNATKRAVLAGYTHVEAADVRTGERFYLPVSHA